MERCNENKSSMTGWMTKNVFYKCFATICLSLIGIGVLTCSDSVGSYQTAMMTHLNLTSSDFALIYAMDSWPNFIPCFFGGYLIDRIFGLKLGTIIYTVTWSIGHLIFSSGILQGVYWLWLLGRLFFGLGTEMTLLCLQCYCIMWFKTKGLNMIISLVISLSRTGTFVVYQIAEPLYQALRKTYDGHTAVGIALFIVGSVAAISLTFSVVISFMDPNKYSSDSYTASSNKPKEKIQFRHILHFPLAFWLLVAMHCAFSTGVFCFIPFSQGYFKTNFHLDTDTANKVISFFSISSAVLAPIQGMVVDKFGKSVFFSMSGYSMVFIGHLFLAFAHSVTPYLGMLLIAIGFALLISTIPAMVSYVIPEHHLGTAFGVKMCIASFGYAVNMQLAGLILDKLSYLAFDLYIMSWSAFGLLSSSLLWYIDWKAHGLINLTPAEKKIRLELKESSDETKTPLNQIDQTSSK